MRMCVWLEVEGSWSEMSREISSSWYQSNLILGADAIASWCQQVASSCCLASPSSETGTGKQLLPKHAAAGLTATQARGE